MILNRQTRVPIALRQLERFLLLAQRSVSIAKDSLTVCLVSDTEIARWNRDYRGKTGPTDVLSFPTDAPPADESHARRNRRGRNAQFVAAPRKAIANYLGDIAIAPAVARRNAQQFGRTFDHEMRILILHGILHLMGYDHAADHGQMERRERRLRRKLGLA